MKHRLSVSSYIVFALIGIGIVTMLVERPQQIMVPVIVFGAVLLLYFFPPNRLIGKVRTGPRMTAARPKPKRKSSAFRVIQGSKRDDDDTPRYH